MLRVAIKRSVCVYVCVCVCVILGSISTRPIMPVDKEGMKCFI